MSAIEKDIQMERRDFLKKSLLVAGTGISTLITPKNSFAFDFWDKILSFKKYSIDFENAKIGNSLEFILPLNDPDGNEVKKERLTIKTESDNESFLKWEIASGNLEKTPELKKCLHIAH